MSGRTKQEFQGLEGEGKNDIFRRIRPKCQCLEGYGQISNVSKNRTRILMFEGIKAEFQCLER